eukprot:1613599-Pyramimonas_sp.AAC.1
MRSSLRYTQILRPSVASLDLTARPAISQKEESESRLIMMLVVAGRCPPPQRGPIATDLPWGRRLGGPWDFPPRSRPPGSLLIPRSGPLRW